MFSCGRIDRISDSDSRKFIDIYVDLSLAYWKSQETPNNYEALADAVFQKYNVDKSFMIKIQKKFENNPKLQLAIYREIIGRLKGFENVSEDSLKKILDKAVDTR
jgi:hypothetical protein